MANTLPNGVVIPAGNDPISGSGVEEMRALGSSVDAQLANRALVGHSHSWDQVTGKPIVFPPGPHRHGWADLDDVPATFPPSAHDHDDRYYTETEADQQLAGKVDTADPRLSDARTPLPHTHTISDTTGLQSELDGKAATGHTHTQAQVDGLPAALTSAAETATWDGVSGKPASYPPSAHTHVQADIEGLDDAIAAATWDRGPIAKNTDLNELKTVGVWSTVDSAVTGSLLNRPPTNSTGAIEVLSIPGTSSSLYMQRYSAYGGSGPDSRIWVRRTASAASGAWSPWRELYTRAEAEAELAGKSDTGHEHDDRYYTEAEIGPRAVSLDTDGTPYWDGTAGTHFVLTDSTGTPYYRETIAREVASDTDGTPILI